MTIKSFNNSIGIIGLGDLGNRIASQELLSGNKVLAYDTNPEIKYLAKYAVDPTIDATNISREHLTLTTINNILDNCSIIHWAVASNQLVSLPTIAKDSHVLLHDSVMNNSHMALKNRPDKKQFVIVHCLMNKDKRVLISNEYGNYFKINQHLLDIGLSPKYITIKSHDKLLAGSQGIFALLIELGIKTELDKAFADGNLTPSALELRNAIINREANWTKQTIQSIMSNPQLLPLTKELVNKLTSYTNRI